jgi:hypothetical protein
VRKPIGDAEVRMRQGSEITVNATNDGDVETAPRTDAA